MGRSTSVFNKRSRDRIARSKKTLGHTIKHVSETRVTTPQAHAMVQANPNAPKNRPPMDRGNNDDESIIERVGRFATNVGVGAEGTVRSYTTDIVDSVGSAITGSDSEVLDRRIKDRTLVDAYVTSAMEGNLDPAFKETQRRIVEQPGRVVGEVAAETAIMLGTMGLGAVFTGGRAAVMAGSKVPMVMKGGVSAVGPGTGAMLKTGRTLRGAKTFEHRQWNLADKSLTITKGKGDKITKVTTKKMNTMDRLEIFGSELGSKIQKASPNVHVPGLGKIRNFYGLGNAGIAGEVSKEAIPRTLGTGKTQFLRKNFAGPFTGKTVDITTKTGTVPRKVKLTDMVKFRKTMLEPAKDLPTERVGKKVPGDLGNWARESASMSATGIRGDAVETVMRTGDEASISSKSAYGQVNEASEEILNQAVPQGRMNQRTLKNSNNAQKFLMKIGASGELDSSAITAGVDITKAEAGDIVDRTIFKFNQNAAISLDDVKLIKSGKKGSDSTYEVQVNDVVKVIVKAKNTKDAATEVGQELYLHASIQNQATGTMASDAIQVSNWLGSVGAQSTNQKVQNLAKHSNVIAAARDLSVKTKTNITPEDYAAELTKNGYNSPASELGGTFSRDILHEKLSALDTTVYGSKSRYLRDKVGTTDEIKNIDYSYQVTPGSSVRTKDDVSTYGAAVELLASTQKQALSGQAKDLPRPFGKKLVGNKFVDDRFKADVINWSASRKIARELINPKTGKNYTSDEVGKLMPKDPKKIDLISADDFRKHTFDTQFSYNADAAKSFKKSDITPNSRESTTKLLATLQDGYDLKAAIRKTDKDISDNINLKSATVGLSVEKRFKKLPLEQRNIINKERNKAFKQAEKIYNEAYPNYLAAAQAKKPGKKAHHYKADAHEAMKKDGISVVKKGRPSKEWKDKYNKAKLEEIQEISETITVTNPLNTRSLYTKAKINNAGKESVPSYKSQNFLPTEPEKITFGNRVGEGEDIVDTLASIKSGSGYPDTPSFMNTYRQEKTLRTTKKWKKRPAWDIDTVIEPELTGGKRGTKIGTSMADLSKLFVPASVNAARTGSRTSNKKKFKREPEPNLYDAYMGKTGITKPNRSRLTFNNRHGIESGLFKSKTASNTFNIPVGKPGRFTKPKSSKEMKMIRNNPYRQQELSKKPDRRVWKNIDPATNMASNFDDIVRVTKKRENIRSFKYGFSGNMFP